MTTGNSPSVKITGNPLYPKCFKKKKRNFVGVESLTGLKKKSFYLVAPSRIPQKAIEIALKNPCFQKDEDEEEIMRDYLKSQKPLPIHLLERACKTNSKDKFISIQYQNLWICLNRTNIERKVSDTRTVNPIVNFHSVYVEPKEHIVQLVKDALALIGTKTELARLCGTKFRQTIYQWTTKETRPQLIGLIKICQLLGKDIWEEIDGCKLYGHSCPEEEAITFQNHPRRELLDLLTWIKLEGHIALSQPKIETSQKKEAESTLHNFGKKFIHLYQMNPKVAFIYDNSIHNGTNKDWTGYKLSISSAPLRQILVLRYNMRPGYKCKTVEISEEIEACENDEDKKQVFSTILETEGSFFPYKQGSPLPRIAVSSASKKFREQASELATELGYRVQKVDCSKGTTTESYDFRINHLHDTIKCFYDVLPYFSHPIKKKRFLEITKDKKLLHSIKLRPTQEIKQLIKRARALCSNNNVACNRELARKIQKDNPTSFEYRRWNVNGWIRGKAVPLQPIIKMCDIVKESYFKYLPRHFSLVLWQQKFINKEEFEKIRK